MNDEERELRALRCRSEMALQSIIERYTPYVSAVISNIIGGSMVGSDVEEAAADVFFVLWENASRSAAGAPRPSCGRVMRRNLLKVYYKFKILSTPAGNFAP